MSRNPSHANNSEDEDADDYVSFPMIPDPEQDNSKTLTRMFTKTLRKVTTNASQLVQNYSYTSPKGHDFDKIKDEIDDKPVENYNENKNEIKNEIKNENKNENKTNEIKTNENKIYENYKSDSRNENNYRNESKDLGQSPNSGLGESRANSPDIPSQPLARGNLVATSGMLSPQGPGVSKLEDSFKSRSAGSSTSGTKRPLDESLAPRVTSDNKSLRLSTIHFPNVPPASVSSNATSSIINVNALATEVSEPVGPRKKPSISSIPEKSLQSKISSIFNNLPNDIELSDDSGSDQETINNSSSNSPVHNHGLISYTHNAPVAKTKRLSSSNHHPSCYDISLYSESTAKSSPIKAELKRSYTNGTLGDSPTLSTIYALRSKDLKPRKKTSSNLSSVLFDNAKSIINNTVTTTPFDVRKRKKKLPKRSSENPLKNGGIPRKYWMNNSFVSDCLNCFKPFTAFRRKHHCRFCGQIFCSECTLFISYNQHKEERKHLLGTKAAKKQYHDKLRVCKPCYSDVIVYLSDSSSSDNEDDMDEAIEEYEPSSSHSNNSEDTLMPNHPLSRIRSLSINSRRESLLNESSMMAANKGFLAEKSSPPAVTPTSTGNNTPRRFPNDLKYPRYAPQMAIPTTRTGEAVEIPVTKNPTNPNSALKNVPATLNVPGASANTHHHVHHHHHHHYPDPYNTKSWFKNYAQLRANMSSSDLQRVSSYDNVTNIYNNIIGRKVSNNKLTTQKDLRAYSVDNSGTEDNLADVEDDQSADSESPDENESENEDEQAMSLYTLLNHGGISSTTSQLSPKPPVANPGIVMPTLGEFPSMVSDKIFPNFGDTLPINLKLTGSKLFSSSLTTTSHSFLEELPKSESLRSRERAHASLERMRSRRKTKSTRNILILTQNNNRLPSLDSTVPKINQFKSSPISTPTSPHMAPLLPVPLLIANYDNELSPTAPRVHDLSEMDNSDVFDTSHMPDFVVNGTEFDDMDSNNSNTISKERVYGDLMDFVLRQSLEDCDIKENQQRWMATLKKAINYINVIKLTDTLDVRQYVKIKKILGGTIEDTSVIDGLFMTKNIDSKRMSFSINNPKIALLMFPIEYLKQKEQFISLRIIHSQQSVYITNLVSRLVSMEPDIVVVGDSVCGLAETLLEEAGVTVISNTKPQVIERISRYTKSDIFQSVNDLFFKKGQLGTCGRFEVKKYIYKNTIKTFSFFVGNDIESGFTISLRGGDEDLLNSVKYAAETLLPGFLNAKFEQSLFDNHLITFLNSDNNSKVVEYNEKIKQIKQNEEIEEEKVCEVSLDSTEVVNYVKLFNERKVSLSPASKFSLPTPLVNVIDSYYSFQNFFQRNKVIQAADNVASIDEEWLNDLKVNIPIEKLPNRENDLLKILKFASDLHLKSLVGEYQTRARIWSNCMGFSSYQLYPVFHKNIHVLHSTVSIKHATPCTGPNLVVIDYYTDNDKCLGLFLDQAFQDSTKVCEECGDSMLNHYKTYAHGNSKLDLILEKFASITNQQNYQGKNQRVMWSYCKECNFTTPIVSMNDETYYLSIGKFLELSFYGENVVVKDHGCNHDFFKSHIRCFGFNDLVIRLECSSIDNYEVVVPKKQLEFMPEIDINLKIESFNSIKTKSARFFGSISKRLNRVKVDTFDKAEDGLLKIEELKEKLDSQTKTIEFKITDIYNSTPPTHHLSLNYILRELQELGVDWDNEFNEFEKNFLPSEHEINKITQFHLRNFLMEKEPEPKEDTKEGSSEEHKTEVDQKEESLKGSQENVEELSKSSESQSSDETIGSLNPDKSKEIGKLIPSSLYQKSIVERISKIEQLLENERNGSHFKKEDVKKLPPPAPLRHLTRKGSDTSIGESNDAPNKVYQLANLFNKMNIDKISMEFKRQREQELQKKSHKFRALPIVESKPIVEIYDKIEDVVDVNDEESKGISNIKKKYSDERKGEDSRKKDDDRRREDTFNQANLTSATTGTVSTGVTAEAAASGKSIEIPQPEKMTLLKSLTNFWADRSATLWDPLEYPLESHEHTFADSDVIVRDDEPSSLVAFCLSSNDYKQKLEAMGKETELADGYDLENNEINNKKINNFSKIEKKFKKKSFSELSTLEKIMVKNKSNHLKYQFIDGNTNLSCKIFYSEQFEAFRRSCGNNDNFIQSLSRCVKWNSSGGKSGSNFLKTLDNRYIVKELSKSELESFVSIAPFYFRYICQSMFNNLSTAIAKIFGFYQIQIKNTITGKTYKMDFLIMENLFYKHKTTRIFDLKGLMRNRHVKQTGKENEVLLDENMIEYIYESPVFVKEQLKKLLRGSLFNDTSFLLAMDVMDYSLVIGIDSTTKKLYIGIIDWLRTFTWDKKVENWVKGNNLIGGNKKGKDPTIVTPKQYRTRFREAMDRYLLEVPDIWYEGAR